MLRTSTLFAIMVMLLCPYVLAETVLVNVNASTDTTSQSILPITENGSITQKPQTNLNEQSPLSFTMVTLLVCVGNTCMQTDPPQGTK